jgi:hypothetical protein
MIRVSEFMKAIKNRRAMLSLGAGWIVATFFGVIISQWIPLRLTEGAEIILYYIILIAVGSFVGGVVMGLLQWMILRRYIKAGLWWIAVTPVGMVFVSFALNSLDFSVTSLILWSMVLGILQWDILRRTTDSKKALWWILATIIGWSAGYYLGIPAYESIGLNGYLIVLGLVNSLISGIALMIILTETKSNQNL